MGRGRQKAKQTKVARSLKYSTYETDLRALEQELGSSSSPRGGLATSDGHGDDEPDDRDDADKR